MPNRYDHFLHVENIRNFEIKLEAETDPATRAILERLMVVEKARKVAPHPRTQWVDK